MGNTQSTKPPFPNLDKVLKAIANMGARENWKLVALEAAEEFVKELRAGKKVAKGEAYPGLTLEQTMQVRDKFARMERYVK